MTREHFNHAAELVDAIRRGSWTNEPPAFVDADAIQPISNYQRAVQTAEAFIILFRAWNPRFDEQRFLKACGLAQ